MKVLSPRFLLALLLLLATALNAAASDNPRVMLVLDSSGSMWGQIEGKAKITIAKEVLAGIAGNMPADFHTGLIAYGHRRKGDCQDIELLLPLQPHDAEAMKAQIDKITPRGKTPLSAAVQMAAQALEKEGQGGAVILLTDGLETCNVDPCQLAADLTKSAVDIKVHVIGYDLSKGDLARLRCLADGTGGLFLRAEDAEALHKALLATVDKVRQPPPPVVEDPGTATLNAPQQVRMGEDFKVAWQGPNSRNDYICLSTLDPQDQHCLDLTYTEQANPAQLTAQCDAGDYELRYVHSHSGTIIGRAPITVIPVQAELQFAGEVAAAGQVEVGWQGPDYPSDYIAIAARREAEQSYLYYAYTSEGNPVKVQAPSEPGTYEVRYVLGGGDKILARKSITVKPATAGLDAPQSVEAAAAIAVQWQGPSGEGDYIAISRPDSVGGDYIAFAYTDTGNPVTLTAPSAPGVYEIRYLIGLDDAVIARRPLEVKAVEAQLAVPGSTAAAASLSVQWQGPDREGDYVAIARPEDGPGDHLQYAYTAAGSPAVLTAPSEPGSYEVRYVLGHDHVVLARQPLEVKGVEAGIEAAASAGVGGSVAVQWQGPGNEGDYISVAPVGSSGGDYLHYAYTAAGNPATLTVPAEPGTYEIRYVLGQGDVVLAARPFEAKAVEAGLQAPATAPMGGMLEVQWQGPNANGDYIAIAKPGQTDGNYEHYEYTATGNPVRLQLPVVPGKYKLRYVLGLDDRLLAERDIAITAVEAAVQGPASAAAGAMIEVAWQGPNANGDFLAIATPEQEGAEYATYEYTSAGNPLRLEAPREPGSYEIRYVLGEGDKIMAKTPFQVE